MSGVQDLVLWPKAGRPGGLTAELSQQEDVMIRVVLYKLAAHTTEPN